MRNELRILEMALSDHPLKLLRAEAQRCGCRTLRQAAGASSGKTLRLAALVAAMRRVSTKRGILQFITLEDETGLLEAVVLPPVYRRLGERVVTPGPFLAEGILVRRQGVPHLEVRGLEPFHQQPRGSG